MLCPGSRSGPLALAAGGLVKKSDLKLYKSIDERSAAFFGLGLATATDKATAIITTSGTAVANLLPAAVEADRSCRPLLFITADRPFRLKNCGANQTVNQEEFLVSVCRKFFQGPKDGIHELDSKSLNDLVNRCWSYAHEFPGPVHLNLPIEEPLHPSSLEQEEVWSALSTDPLSITNPIGINYSHSSLDLTKKKEDFPDLDHSLPGLVIVGPWRGSNQGLLLFKEVLKKWTALSKWPIFADPLSGLSYEQSGLIHNWDLLLSIGLKIPEEGLQVLRLGPMPASRTLESWLKHIGNHQLLISEGDSRPMDPLGLSYQWNTGFVEWWKQRLERTKYRSQFFDLDKNSFSKDCLYKDMVINDSLERYLPLQGAINEPALARWLPRLLPKGLPIMLSASSPIRDVISYSGESKLSRRFYSFRGASGIDGTLSLAMGLSIDLGPLVLLTGDLALLHDTNGWLFSCFIKSPLIVLLIDNGGGGIFKQIPIEESSFLNIDELFSMPQHIDQLSLVDSYGIPNRQISTLEDLENSLDWGLSQSGAVLLRVCTNPSLDLHLRNDLKKYLVTQVKKIP